MKALLLICLMALPWGSRALAARGSFEFGDCHAEWTDETLMVRNSRIERRWRIQNGLLLNTSLKDVRTGQEYLTGPSPTPSPGPEFAVAEQPQQTAISASREQPVVVENPSMGVSVRSQFEGFTLTTRIRIYPRSPAVSTWLEIDSPYRMKAASSPAAVQASGQESVRANVDATSDTNEVYRLDHRHKTLLVVALMDDTDVHDNLVQVSRYSTALPDMREALKGNLFVLEDQFTGNGLAFLKEAPLPHARPDKSDSDIAWLNGLFVLRGLGAGTDTVRRSYPLTTILYTGGSPGRTAALHAYQREHRQYNATLDEKIWHCTWGDRNRDGRVSEAFLQRELDRILEIGMDHLYFTDGWQKGPSKNSVVPGGLWENQWSRPDYWDVNPTRFPDGLEPLVNRAHANGVQVGMWHNVDKVNDYANWQRDVDRILANFRRYNTTNVKFDAVLFTTKRGEQNVYDAMHRVVQESEGRIAVEIDITAGIRHGYFGAMPYGFLFLENRYAGRYYPHTTLRNLWQLSHWVDPSRLRVEFLNGDRHAAVYPESDKLAPHRYRFDQLFATTMFANPLAWFEVTGLNDKQVELLKSVVPQYKKHREAIHRGLILPIGQEPSGQAWTGFQSFDPGQSRGYIVAFRELNPAREHNFSLADLAPGRYRFTSIFGFGQSFETTVAQAGTVSISLPQELNYGFWQYQRLP